MKSLPRYTVQKISKNDAHYGKIHYASEETNANQTLCGKEIDSKWCILTNNFKGKATCSKCKILNEKNSKL